MNRKYWIFCAGIMAIIMIFGSADANSFFVATAQNFRGALYQGFGPTPSHASEMAIVKCSQDSFAPRSCQVMWVRMECPPPVCAPPMRKPMSKTRISSSYTAGQSWGRPMP